MISAQILLIFEDGKATMESIQYSIEYAKRMGATLCLLMLIDNLERSTSEQTEIMLKQFVDLIGQNGISSKYAIRAGDKASEFLKLVALEGGFSTIVWGGHENIFSGLLKKKEHWFLRVTSDIECPIVTTKIKKSSQ